MVDDNYVHSVQMATVNYVMKSSVERERLGIAGAPKDLHRADWGWGNEKPIARVPPGWAERVDTSRDVLEQSLYICTPDDAPAGFMDNQRYATSARRSTIS